MEAVPLVGLPKLHGAPVALVTCDSPRIIVEVDNDKGKRIRLVFEPYQAVRIITADCFEVPEGVSIAPQTIVEIRNSTWVDALRNTLKATDYEADFMDKARHFLLPLQDDFLEIVAWNVRAESVS